MKTYDFLRTTRLTSTELVVGKILGAPIMPYFLVACSMPVTVLVGILGGFSVWTILWIYVLMLCLAISVSLLSLLGSMLGEKSSGGALGLGGLLVAGLAFQFVGTPFPGFGAISVVPALLSLYGAEGEMARLKPTLLGFPVSFFLVTLLLYTTFGAWFVLMLRRNLKRDRDQIRLLSRWQAVGFAVFLNMLFYAFLDPRHLGGQDWRSIRSQEVSGLAVGVNLALLFLVGLVMLSPAEKLKVWWRRRAAGGEGYFSESGPPWPWLVPTSLAAYALLVIEALGMQSIAPLKEWRLAVVGIQFLVILVFTCRDILFIQWCMLTRMKRPVLKGVLYLGLYYVAAGIVAGVVGTMSSTKSRFLVEWLTPVGAAALKGVGLSESSGLYFGLVFQVALIALFLNAIGSRLKRPALVPSVSEV